MRFSAYRSTIYRTLILFFFIVSGFSGNSVAQRPNKARLSVGGGFSFPLKPSDFSQNWDLGFNLSIGLDYSVEKFFALRGSLEYYKFSRANQGYYEPYLASKGEIYIYGLLVSGKIYVPGVAGSMKSYFLGGLGFNKVDQQELSLNFNNSPSIINGYTNYGPSIFMGHGFEIPVAKNISVFIEGRYSFIFKKNEDLHLLPVFFGFKAR